MGGQTTPCILFHETHLPNAGFRPPRLCHTLGAACLLMLGLTAPHRSAWGYGPYRCTPKKMNTSCCPPLAHPRLGFPEVTRLPQEYFHALRSFLGWIQTFMQPAVPSPKPMRGRHVCLGELNVPCNVARRVGRTIITRTSMHNNRDMIHFPLMDYARLGGMFHQPGHQFDLTIQIHFAQTSETLLLLALL